MSQLDQALEACLQDPTKQEDYYRLILNSDFYIPLQEDDSETPMKERDEVLPLIVQNEEKPYLLLFDSEERLNEWAKQPTHFAILTGLAAADLSPPALHWAVNLGGKFVKEFVPDEIAHLKELATEEEPSD
ncbi:MAG: hypothetical protein C0624_01305 [Desulfuromonas sp.]|nr:MAG: hypothetical protein C0624_01305 [Desulfuromonas sp.]